MLLLQEISEPITVFFFLQELYGAMCFPSTISLSQFYHLYCKLAPKWPQIHSWTRWENKKAKKFNNYDWMPTVSQVVLQVLLTLILEQREKVIINCILQMINWTREGLNKLLKLVCARPGYDSRLEWLPSHIIHKFWSI